MKKILSISLIFVLLITSFIKVNAAETTITTEGDQNISVIADVSAVFEVTVPSSISITDFDTTEFDIKGTGNISKYEYLSISIPNTVKMECEGEYSENLPITTSSDRFLREELMSNDGGTISCSIDSSTLPSGSWTGEFNINISVKDLYYRLPDTINYNYPYTIVTRFVDGTIQIWNHEKPLYYYEPSGAYYAGTLNAQNTISGSRCNRYKENTEGNWVVDSSSTIYSSSPFACHQYTIIYCNYDIYKNTGELWQTKLCPE